jgi:hypothetical protein
MRCHTRQRVHAQASSNGSPSYFRSRGPGHGRCPWLITCVLFIVGVYLRLLLTSRPICYVNEGLVTVITITKNCTPGKFVLMEQVTTMLATDDPGYAGDLTQRRRDVLRAEKLLTEVGIDCSKRYQLPTTEDNAAIRHSSQLTVS